VSSGLQSSLAESLVSIAPQGGGGYTMDDALLERELRSIGACNGRRKADLHEQAGEA